MVNQTSIFISFSLLWIVVIFFHVTPIQILFLSILLGDNPLLFSLEEIFVLWPKHINGVF
jgi:hypothetical protein